MTAATRKASERARRKADGQVALSGWLSAPDHAALTQMARESGMTQAQVVSRLIGMRAAVLELEWRCEATGDRGIGGEPRLIEHFGPSQTVSFSDLTAAVGLTR